MPEFRTPRNTTDDMQDPVERMLFFADAMGRSASAPIEAQEAAGQRELVNSDVIPTDLHGQEEEFTALGFVLGDPVPGDRLFRQATLPAGWKREASDHSMGSYIVDELGRRRISVFYKAAFYDRSANASIVSVYGYVSECLYEGTVPVLDEEWATKTAVIAEIEKIRDVEAERAENPRRDDGYRAEYRERVARCDALKTQVEALT